jgi:hypothetical protein
VLVKADHALGPATVKLLDHHRVALATRKQAIGEIADEWGKLPEPDGSTTP